MSSLETPEATPTVHKKKISFYSVALVIQIRRSFAGGSIWRQIRLESGKNRVSGLPTFRALCRRPQVQLSRRKRPQ